MQYQTNPTIFLQAMKNVPLQSTNRHNNNSYNKPYTEYGLDKFTTSNFNPKNIPQSVRQHSLSTRNDQVIDSMAF